MSVFGLGEDKVDAVVLLAGGRGSGKTHTMLTLLAGEALPPGTKTKQTDYLNNEVASIGPVRAKKRFELVDPSGEYPEFWGTIVNHVGLDCVIYCINSAEVVDSKAARDIYVEDRMELHSMMLHENLCEAKFIVFCNFKVPDEALSAQHHRMVTYIRDALDLHQFPLKRKRTDATVVPVQLERWDEQGFDVEVVFTMEQVRLALLAPNWSRIRRGDLFATRDA